MRNVTAGVAMMLCALMVGCSHKHHTPVGPVTPNCERLRPIGAWDYDPAWSPDGDSVVYIHAHRDSLDTNALWIAGANGPPHKLWDTDDPFIGPLSWSPDGKTIAMCYQREVWTLDIATKALHQWTLGNLWTDNPEWMPDNRHILCQLPYGTMLVDTYTGGIRPVMRDSVHALGTYGRVAIARDDTTLIVSQSTDGDNTFELYSTNLTGSSYRQLTHLGGSALNPQWGPSEQALYFDFTPAPCYPEGSPLRSTWSLAGGNARQSPANLGDIKAQFGFPFIVSQASGKVAYVGVDSTGLGAFIWTVNLDGSGRRQLTHLADGQHAGSSSAEAQDARLAPEREIAPLGARLRRRPLQ